MSSHSENYRSNFSTVPSWGAGLVAGLVAVLALSDIPRSELPYPLPSIFEAIAADVQTIPQISSEKTIAQYSHVSHSCSVENQS